MLPTNADMLERNARSETVLPSALADPLAKKLREGKLPGISEIRKDGKSYGRDILWNCSLPGDYADKVLVITLSPLANYE
jgi:hypothetical protein